MIICTQAMGDMPRELDALGCHLRTIGVFRTGLDREALGRAVEHLREFQPHIVHGSVYEGVVTATLGGLRTGVPVIVAEESSDPDGRRWTGHLFFRAMLTFARKVVAVSPFVERYLLNTLKVPRRKVVLISNGVEAVARSELSREVVRARYGFTDDEVVLGTVGRLNAEKRVGDALHAFAELRRSFPNVRLLVVGDGREKAALEALAAELGLGDAAVFAGYQADPGPFFQAMDIVVHTTSRESFGLALAEAMFAARPIVATRVGGIPDVVEEGATAFLVPPARPDLMAERLTALIADPALREQMGRAGLERAERHFSERRYVQDMDALYRSLVPGEPRPRR